MFLTYSSLLLKRERAGKEKRRREKKEKVPFWKEKEPPQKLRCRLNRVRKNSQREKVVLEWGGETDNKEKKIKKISPRCYEKSFQT